MIRNTAAWMFQKTEPKEKRQRMGDHQRTVINVLTDETCTYNRLFDLTAPRIRLFTHGDLCNALKGLMRRGAITVDLETGKIKIA